MLAIVRNVESEMSGMRNKVTREKNRLDSRSIDEEDIRTAKAKLGTLANHLSATVDGLESAAEYRDET